MMRLTISNKIPGAIFILAFVFLLNNLSAQTSSITPQTYYPSIGDRAYQVFDSFHLFFNPGFEAPTFKTLRDAPGNSTKSIYRLDGGRTILTPLIIPRYERAADIKLKLTLVSAGDPWDKLGSVFVLPHRDLPGFLSLGTDEQSSGKAENPDNKSKSENEKDDEQSFRGITPTAHYNPPVELLHFITPFGVGYYSDSMQERRPIYIPEWADQSVYIQNISHLGGLLRDTIWVGVFIDCWTAEGYRFDLELNFDESDLECDPPETRLVVPILNTVKYQSGQKLYDEFSRQSLQLTLAAKTLKQLEHQLIGGKRAVLFYTATGHGGHSEGDEFHPHENRISLNGEPLFSYTPWRDDCASFRRFNPHAGVWTDMIEWKGDSIPERIASSDFSRSGWCPGSSVPPKSIPFRMTNSESVTFGFEIENAQPIRENEFNYWAVSAYLLLDR